MAARLTVSQLSHADSSSRTDTPPLARRLLLIKALYPGVTAAQAAELVVPHAADGSPAAAAIGGS